MKKILCLLPLLGLTSCSDAIGNPFLWITLIFIIGAVIAAIASNSNNSEKEEETRKRRAEIAKHFEEMEKQSQSSPQTKEESIEDIFADIRRISHSDENKVLANALEAHSHEKSIIFEVVGAYYRSDAAKDEYDAKTPGMDVSLRRDLKNPKDEHAVKVISDRLHIGYVPKKYSEQVSDIIAQKCVSAAIVVSNPKMYTGDYSGMKVRLFIKDKYVDDTDQS